MTPGHNQILRLPRSKKLVKIETIASGNTCGARYWSDGKAECPMLPERLWLRVHPENSELFWVDECEDIDRESPWEKLKKYSKIPFAAEPSLDDYRRALDPACTTGKDKRRYALTRFWWAANDPVRHKQPGAGLPADFREKLMELRSLLDTRDLEQRLMVVEIVRESGDFEQAVRMLEFPFPKDFSYHVRKFREWSLAKDASVREMKDG